MAVPWHPGGYKPPGYPSMGGGGGGGGCLQQIGCLILMFIVFALMVMHC